MNENEEVISSLEENLKETKIYKVIDLKIKNEKVIFQINKELQEELTKISTLNERKKTKVLGK
jgi:hypothetical protein